MRVPKQTLDSNGSGSLWPTQKGLNCRSAPGCTLSGQRRTGGDDAEDRGGELTDGGGGVTHLWEAGSSLQLWTLTPPAWAGSGGGGYPSSLMVVSGSNTSSGPALHVHALPHLPWIIL